jgi:hypothetical protein
MTEHCYEESRLCWLPYSEYHILAPYAECLYAECRYAECRDAIPKYIFIKAQAFVINWLHKLRYLVSGALCNLKAVVYFLRILQNVVFAKCQVDKMAWSLF